MLKCVRVVHDVVVIKEMSLKTVCVLASVLIGNQPSY